MIPFLADHLWQSTVVALALGGATLAFRHNSAQVRYGLWFTASLKFLVPFAALTALGAAFQAPRTAEAHAAIITAISTMAFPASTLPAAQPAQFDWPTALALIWTCGFLTVLAIWLRKWLEIRRAVRVSVPTQVRAPIPIKATTANIEPGLVGIVRPILLIPEGLSDYLTEGEFNAVLAHEFCHLRRRDNLAAAIHMLVQAVFWFHPLVWWIGTRLVAERERACDEAVTAATSPEVYAEGILKVCKLYAQSPLICAAGVSGSNLKERIERIVAQRPLRGLSSAQRLLLIAAAVSIPSAPIVLGWTSARAQQTATAAPASADVDMPEVRVAIGTPQQATLVAFTVLKLACANPSCDAERGAIQPAAPRIADAFKAALQGLTFEDVKDTAGLLKRRGMLLEEAKAASGAPELIKDLAFKVLWVASREYSKAYFDAAWVMPITPAAADPDGLRLAQIDTQTIRTAGVNAVRANASITNISATRRGFPPVSFQLMDGTNRVVQQAAGLPRFCCLEAGAHMDIELAVRARPGKPLKMVAVWATPEVKSAALYDASKEQTASLRILDNGFAVRIDHGHAFFMARGYIFNTNTIVMKLPPLRLELYNDAHEIVGKKTAPAPAPLLQPGTAAPYTIEMEIPPSPELVPSYAEHLKSLYTVALDK